MKLKDFANELVYAWRSEQKGLSGIQDNHQRGIEGEKTVLNKLRKSFIREAKTQFTRTPNSWSPADIIGLRRKNGIWHFALYQVKLSEHKNSLTSEIVEKKTLPKLAKFLKKEVKSLEASKGCRNRKILITIGYIGVWRSNGRNKVEITRPYSNILTLNNPELTSTEKTALSSSMHRLV